VSSHNMTSSLSSAAPAVAKSNSVAEDAAAVIASLPGKLVHLLDEPPGRADIQTDTDDEFTRWFEQLVITPSFIASIDAWD